MTPGHSIRAKCKLSIFKKQRLAVLFLSHAGKWSESVKPVVNTESCQQMHTGYLISGRMRVRMDDGTEAEAGPGDSVIIPPGHDAWVVGNEPCIGIDFTGAKTYAK